MDELSSSFVDDQAGAPAVELQLDAVPMKLSGSAVAPNEEQGDDLVLGLMLGSVFLGTIRHERTRADIAGEHAPQTGFDVPDFGLGAFAAIAGLSGLGITAERGEGQVVRLALPNKQEVPCSPLGIRHKNSLGFRLADLWLENSRNLSLRFEADARVLKTMDAYQCANSALVSVASDRSIGRMASLVSIALINPFSPVLFVFKGEDGSIDAIDFLPFPSLVRGGSHAAERVILRGGADEVKDTAALSGQLVKAWLERLERPSECVEIIRIDPAIETGLEPILDDDLLNWITESLGVAIEVGDGPSQIPTFIAELLARRSGRASATGHVLHLPADCIPTISALVRRLPANAAAGVVSGGMGVVDCSRRGRIWSVWQPSFVSRFEGFQFAEANQFAPALTVRGDEDSDSARREIRMAWPLALAFRDQLVRVGRNSPFEIAPDYEGPLLREGTDPEPRSISVLVLHDPASRDPLPLFESIARQTSIQISNFVICRPNGEENSKLAESLGQLFGEGFSIVDVPAGAGRLEQVACARGRLAEDVVFIANSATIMPDARTLSVLVQMLKPDDVASVGCLVRAGDEGMSPVCAGYCFRGIDFRGMPGVCFDPIDPAIWRGPSTYPVVANALSALVTRRELLADMTADGSTAVQPESDDLLFGIGLLDRGGINLCTTIVSVYSGVTADRSWAATLSVPYRLSTEDVARIAQSSANVQRAA
jgi:hypothetical protein